MNFSHSKAKKPPSENNKMANLISQLQPQSQQLPLPIIPSGLQQLVPPSLNLLQQNQQKNPPSFDLVFDPTKKIKHSQDTSTQQVSEIKEVPLKERNFPANNLTFLRGESNDLQIKNLISSQLPAGMDLAQQTHLNQLYSNYGLSPMLFPPPTVLDLLKYQQYQQLEQQLRQQQLINQYRAQHQLLNQLENQQLKPIFQPSFTGLPLSEKIIPQVIKNNQNFPSSFLNQQNEALRRDYLMTKNGSTFEEKTDLKSRKSSLFSSEKQELEDKTPKMPDALNELEMAELKDTADLEDLKNSELASKWESVSHSSEGRSIEQKKKTTKVKTKPKTKKPRAKKVKQKSQDSALKQELDQAKKNDSRRKNKWQMMTEQKQEEARAEDQGFIMTGKEPGYQREDDRNVDYEYLLSVKITNDPVKIGRENPETKFVVLNRDNIAQKINEPRVGNRYQVSVANSQLKSARKDGSRRNIPELLWNPDIISENQIADYVDSLCKMLKCERINMEKALKLLKRKDYKKDKVLLNISKNEKFYSSFLVMRDDVNGSANENTIQQSGM